MKGSSFYPVLVVVFFINTLQFTSSLPAQSIWQDKSNKNSVTIEILKPEFSGYSDLTSISSAIFLSGRYSLKEKLNIVAEIPIVQGGFVYYYYGSTGGVDHALIGNPYVGVEIQKPKSNLSGEFGIRIPLINDQFSTTSHIGKYTDFDRYEAFQPHILTLTGKINYYNKISSNFFYRLRGGPTLWIYTKDYFDNSLAKTNFRYDSDDMDIWLDYSGQIIYKEDNLDVIAGFTGRFLTTVNNADLSDITYHQLGLAANAHFGIVSPGAILRVPIDNNLNDIIEFVVGLNLSVQLP